MAVYTHISRDQLEEFLILYDLGALVSFKGIEAGVSNSNYVLQTERGKYVLTLFEPHRVEPKNIPFFLAYAEDLASKGLPCPAPIRTRQEEMKSNLAGRPAVIVPFMEGTGQSFDSVTPESCKKAGVVAARMHRIGKDFPMRRENDFGLPRVSKWLSDMGEALDDIKPGLYHMAREELVWQKAHWPRDLPEGAVHGDYFPDNVFFNESGEICAVLDFHFACTDSLAYDLAVSLNAWCFSEARGTTFDEERYKAFMDGYRSVRLLEEAETEALPVLLRGTALRTSLARCEELTRHDPADLMTPHDPLAYIQRLEYWQNEQNG